MKPQFDVICPHSERWPRHSEGSIAVFPDGRWLLAWSAFYGGYTDASPAHIMGKWSTNKGKTWSEPIMLLENDGKCNVLSVSIKPYRDGSIGWVHSRTDHDNCFEAWPFYRKSVDGGQTWSHHKPMVDMKTWHGFPCNNRLLELSSGRILLPLQLNTWSSSSGQEEGFKGFVQAAYSDDMGDSWKLSNSVSVGGETVTEGKRPSGAAEPAAFERRDGTIMFLVRTRLGTIWASKSSDDGESLSESWDTGLESPAAPCDVARIPSTGDILLVWNKTRPNSPNAGLPRTPLTTAISHDEGNTWDNFKNLEHDTNHAFMYPGIAFDGDTTLIQYSESYIGADTNTNSNYMGADIWSNSSLKLARVPTQWLYE